MRLSAPSVPRRMMRWLSLSARNRLPTPSRARGPGVAPRPASALASNTVDAPPRNDRTPADVDTRTLPSEVTTMPPGLPSAGSSDARSSTLPPLTRSTVASLVATYTDPAESTVTATTPETPAANAGPGIPVPAADSPKANLSTVWVTPRPAATVAAVVEVSPGIGVTVVPTAPGTVVTVDCPTVVAGAVFGDDPPPSARAATTATAPTPPPMAATLTPTLRPPRAGFAIGAVTGSGTLTGGCQAAVPPGGDDDGAAVSDGSAAAPASAAPTAMVNFGCASRPTGRLVAPRTSSATIGIREVPPTRSTRAT